MATSRFTLTRSPTVKVSGTVGGAAAVEEEEEEEAFEEEEVWEEGSGVRISIGSPEVGGDVMEWWTEG